MYFGFNYGAIVESHQYYRILSSTLSHQGVAHILFNMCWMAIFGYTIEKRFGTLFFAVINIWIMFLSTAMHLVYFHLRVYVLPVELGGGAIDLLWQFAIGYSAILFGILMLECISGERYVPVFGFQFPKILIPFGYLILSQLLAPNADMFGHLSGMACAPILKYFGMMELRLLPRYAWIKAFEDQMYDCTKAILARGGYYYGSETIMDEFVCMCCRSKQIQTLFDAR